MPPGDPSPYPGYIEGLHGRYIRESWAPYLAYWQDLETRLPAVEPFLAVGSDGQVYTAMGEVVACFAHPDGLPLLAVKPLGPVPPGLDPMGSRGRLAYSGQINIAIVPASGYAGYYPAWDAPRAEAQAAAIRQIWAAERVSTR